ncbi:MAG TPA: hypothetical protein VLA16_12605, partial [Ideonella sp.]|nr:hypothetical protein [Ideonella sp.]
MGSADSRAVAREPAPPTPAPAAGPLAPPLEAGATIVGTTGNDYIGPNSPGGKPSTTTGNDQVRGLAGNDYIDGWLGDDRLDGGDGNDTLLAGEGSDTLYGGAGHDELQLQVTVDPLHPDDDVARAYGGTGNDTIEAFEGFYPGGRGASGTFDGGADDDRLVIWARQRADLDTRVLGGDGQDSLEVSVVAGPGQVVVDGGAGDDVLMVDCFDPFPTWSGSGSQTLVTGGLGNDQIAIRASNLLGSAIDVDAGDGNDTVAMSYVNDGGVSIGLGAGNDSLDLYFTNDIAVTAGAGADQVQVGNSVGVAVNAGSGNDRIFLDATQATVTTGAGRDTVFASSSHGADTVRASTVKDFTAGDGGDRLDLDGVNALLGLSAGSDPFADGRARMEQGSQGALLTVNTADGGGSAQWVTVLILKGVAVSSLTPDNFVQAVSPPAGEAPIIAGHGLIDLGPLGEALAPVAQDTGGGAHGTLSWQQAFSHAPGGELDLSALEGGAPAAAGAAGAAAG